MQVAGSTPAATNYKIRKKEKNMEVRRIKPKIYVYELLPDVEECESCSWALFIFDCYKRSLKIKNDGEDYYCQWTLQELGGAKQEDFMKFIGQLEKSNLIEKFKLSRQSHPIICLDANMADWFEKYVQPKIREDFSKIQ